MPPAPIVVWLAQQLACMLARYCYRSKDQIDAEAVVPVPRVHDHFRCWPIATLPQEFMSATPPKADQLKPGLARTQPGTGRTGANCGNCWPCYRITSSARSSNA